VLSLIVNNLIDFILYFSFRLLGLQNLVNDLFLKHSPVDRRLNLRIMESQFWQHFWTTHLDGGLRYCVKTEGFLLSYKVISTVFLKKSVFLLSVEVNELLVHVFSVIGVARCLRLISLVEAKWLKFIVYWGKTSLIRRSGIDRLIFIDLYLFLFHKLVMQRTFQQFSLLPLTLVYAI